MCFNAKVLHLITWDEIYKLRFKLYKEIVNLA